MASPGFQDLLNVYGSPQRMRDAINAGQLDVTGPILNDINTALGGVTNYTGPLGAGLGIYPQGAGGQPTGGAPPASPPSTTQTPPAAPTAAPGMPAGARATLTAMLSPFGLESLVGPAYDLQVAGVTDPTAMVLALENTQEFRARFPGMRDPTTNQLIMTPAEYVSYEKSVNQLFADNGIPLPDPAELGSFVQQRRSVNELTTDVQAYSEIKQNPFIGDQFYAITGMNPGPEGVFALLTGQAPNLEAAYNASVAGGVDAATYASRLASTETGGTFTADDIMKSLQTDPTTLFNAGASPLNNMDKTIALQRAVAANAAEYKAGGQAAVSTSKLFTTF
jgi:hypothetical protein